jgi:hypothetical protein
MQEKTMAAKNTDKEIWRQPTTDYGEEDGTDRNMEPYVFSTKDNKVGMNHYGKCSVKSIEEWIGLAWATLYPQSNMQKTHNPQEEECEHNGASASDIDGGWTCLDCGHYDAPPKPSQETTERMKGIVERYAEWERLDQNRTHWTLEQWKNSDDPIDRTIWYISTLSPHNLWKGREAIEHILSKHLHALEPQ